MTRVKLTPILVKEAACPELQTKRDYFDLDCRGLMLEVRKSGGKTYYLRYQDERGRTRQYKLASADDVSLAQARQLIQKARTQIALGRDPLQVRAEKREVPTFAEFVEDAYLPYVQTYKRSWRADVSLLKNHLLPRFGRMYMDEIKREAVLKLLLERRQSKAAAGSINRLLVLLRFIFNLAIKWEVAGVKSNPAKSIPTLEENNKIERYLTMEEAQALYAQVCHSESTMLKFIVPMLILTGARKREVLDSKWEDFDLVRRVWRIPISKSGKARHVPLAEGAMHVLSSVPRFEGCVWAFPNPTTRKPFVTIYESWNTARQRAGLPDVRMHDLRHSFASILINQGRTLYEVQHILGHAQMKTTQRYAHLSANTLLDAAGAASKMLRGVMLPQDVQKSHHDPEA